MENILHLLLLAFVLPYCVQLLLQPLYSMDQLRGNINTCVHFGQNAALTTFGSGLLHRITVPSRKGLTYGGIYTCTFISASDAQLQCHHIFMLSVKGPLFIPPVPLLNCVSLNEPAQRHKTWLSATALKCGNIFKQLLCFILEQSRLQTIVGSQLSAPFDGLTDLWYLIAVCRSQIRTSVRRCWNNTLVVWIARHAVSVAGVPLCLLQVNETLKSDLNIDILR